MSKSRIALAAVVVLLVGAFFVFDVGQYLSLDYFKSQQARFDAQYQAHTVRTIGIFVAVYVAVTGLSLPGAGVMTLAAGALFGPWVGTLAASIGASVGACIAFTIARFVAREPVQRRFGQRLRAVNEGVKRDGAFYLLTLRLVPLFPFFVINLVMALTPIRLSSLRWSGGFGMLPGTLVFANAGTQLAQIEDLRGILSCADRAVLLPAGGVSVPGAQDRRCHKGAPRLSRLHAPERLRARHGRGRCGLGRSGGVVHCNDRPRQGDAD